MNLPRFSTWLPVTLSLSVGLLAVTGAYGQSLSLDDNPASPLNSPPGGIPGLGAEDEFGLSAPAAALAPSPSLAGLGSDGAIFSPGVPPAAVMTPNGGYVDAVSTNHATTLPPQPRVTIQFSVDRTTVGTAGSALGVESGSFQQPGDIYTSTAAFFPPPAAFVGTLAPGYNGLLASAGGGGSNALLTDDSGFGLTTSAGVVGPGVPVPPPSAGSHDNLDGFDFVPLGAAGTYPVHSYLAVSPDVGLAFAISAADILDVAAGASLTQALPYATALSMGLDQIGSTNIDSIDALVVWDNNQLGGPANNGPGAEPGIDYALFSLAPGSTTLSRFAFDAADVFFTDFTRGFATYALATDLGVFGAAGGPVFGVSNIDALEVTPVPEPTGWMLAAFGLLGLLGFSRRKRRAG